MNAASAVHHPNTCSLQAGSLCYVLEMRGRFVAIAAIALFAAAAATELAMGRHPICTCGTIDLWVGSRDSPKTSQMLLDWYSFSHIAHGLLFYAILWLIARRWPVEWRFLVAVVVEAGWEILENSPIIIDRYRAATAAIGYSGDSILNSMSDIAMMCVGFLVARKLPVWGAVLLLLVLELVPLYAIRDNLTLNIWMLLWPNDMIRSWQAGH
jgi:hypothetical protein